MPGGRSGRVARAFAAGVFRVLAAVRRRRGLAGVSCSVTVPGTAVERGGQDGHGHRRQWPDRRAARRLVRSGTALPASPTSCRSAGSACGHPSSAKMWPVGWEALEQWGDDVVRGKRLTGGAGVNGVWSVRVNGHLAVGRLGQRSDADLAWETDLLRHLHREGTPVPVPIPTTDGRHFVDGLVVMTYVEGGSPETEADWRRVAGTLRQLHRFTHGWPQRRAGGRRPTFCTPRPGRKSTSARCRLRVSCGAGQRGRDSQVARRASSTATPTRATSA